MDREKLYLIRNIVIDADRHDYYLPDDVVSCLYQENTSLLKKIIDFDQSTLKKEKQFLFNFVFQSELPSVEKEQILDHLMDYAISNPAGLVNNYTTMLTTVSNLHPTSKEMNGIIKSLKKDNNLSAVITPFVQVLRIKLNAKEILEVLRPISEEKDWDSQSIYIIPRIFFDMCPYLDERLISHDTFLQYLSWGLKEPAISYALSSKEMLSLVRNKKMTEEDLKQIMTWIYQEEIKNRVEMIFTSLNFRRLVDKESISVKDVLNFIEKHLEEKDSYSISILTDILLRVEDQYLTKDGVQKVDHLALTEKISSIGKKSEATIYPNPILYSFLKNDYSEEALLQIVKFLNSLREEQRYACRNLLQQLPQDINLSTIQELLEQFVKLDPVATSMFTDMFSMNNNRLYMILRKNKEYYSIIFYLFDHLSNPVTEEELDKLFTVGNILTTIPDLACVGEKECQKVFEDINNSRHIIDLVFSTTEEWQRRNMVSAAKENFHYKNIAVDSYLAFIEYASIYPPCEEKIEKFNRYSKQIEEIDQLLRAKEENNSKIKALNHQ
jgi:hypothetical protein